ncbi:MAG: hypothetical protein D6741_12525 [Planctomycetota bacterium]|nr:MAG: hypothetical protein D6741_12525 [Planctomycetota bacterium]
MFGFALSRLVDHLRVSEEKRVMLKKILIGTGIVVLVSGFFFGRDLFSYVKTSMGYAHSAVVDAVPMEFQIERARGMIEDLLPEIRKNMLAIAKEEVEVERLEKQIAQARENLEVQKSHILRLKDDLAGGKVEFVYAGRKYTADEVKADLAARFERYQTSEATLADLEKIYRARVKSLEAARKKMDGMLAAKRQLEVEVENLQARLQMIQAAETTSAYQFDETRLGRARELVDELKSKLDVAEKLVSSEGTYTGEIPLDEPSREDIVEQVSAYFADQPEVSQVAGAE